MSTERSRKCLRKCGVQDDKPSMAANENGMEERGGDQPVRVDFGTAGQSDHGEAGDRVASQAERTDCARGRHRTNPLIEAAHTDGFGMDDPGTKVLEESELVCAGVQNQHIVAFPNSSMRPEPMCVARPI